MAAGIVEISIAAPTFLLQVVQGIRIPFRIRQALREIPKLLNDLSVEIEEASERNADLRSQTLDLSALEQVCSRNEQKLELMKAHKDKVDGRMIEKRWSLLRRMFFSIQTKQKLELTKNELDGLVRDIYNILSHIQLYRQGSLIPDLSTGNRICSNFVKAICWRLKSVWGIARQTGTLHESLAMLQKSADCGDKLAVLDLASIHNLELVPGVDRLKSVTLLKKLCEQRENRKLFSEGVLYLNISGEYEHNKHLAFERFDSIVRGGSCELRGKASYYAGLCHRYSCYGAQNDPIDAIHFMDIGAKAGVFYCLVNLAATYKHGFGVDVNHAKYDELVRELEEGSGIHAEVEEAAFKFQADHYTSPFHGCNVDCVYKGFCYLKGICVAKDVEKGSKLIRISAEKGHSLACKIVQDEELH